MTKTLAASAFVSVKIDLTTLKTGTYFIEIISNQGKTTKKFVKL